jgi:hypothetical protein
VKFVKKFEKKLIFNYLTRPPTIPVYNITVPEHQNFSWKLILDTGRKIFLKYPFEAGIWYPGKNADINYVVL